MANIASEKFIATNQNKTQQVYQKSLEQNQASSINPSNLSSTQTQGSHKSIPIGLVIISNLIILLLLTIGVVIFLAKNPDSVKLNFGSKKASLMPVPTIISSTFSTDFANDQVSLSLNQELIVSEQTAITPTASPTPDQNFQVSKEESIILPKEPSPTKILHPEITAITLTDANWGDTITLRGHDFGNKRACLTFETAAGAGKGSLCNDHPQILIWSDSEVTFRLTLYEGETNYQVKVTLNDYTTESNWVNFYQRSWGPYTSHIVENPERKLKEVTLHGERLGTNPGKIRFYPYEGIDGLLAEVSPNSWNDEAIKFTIPDILAAGTEYIVKLYFPDKNIEYTSTILGVE